METLELHSAVVFGGITALVITLALTPLVIVLARRLGVIDDPSDERRVHERPTPRMGGLAMMVAIVASTIIWVQWRWPVGDQLRNAEQLLVVLVCCVAISLVGALDDARGIPWHAKLWGQVGVALATIFAPMAGIANGLSQLLIPVRVIDLPFLHPIHLGVWTGIAIATLWMVALMNMMNFIDGVDGLAAGMAAITAVMFAIVAGSYGREAVAIFAAAVGGAAVGFLPFNFRAGGARVFMGDAGSMLLGYALAVIALQGVLKTSAAVSLFTPLALLAIPILDTMFVVAKRVKYRQSIAAPDRWHLHHRLLNVGYSPRRVAIAFWMWTASLSAVTLALRFVPYGNSKDWHFEGLAVLLSFCAVALVFTIHLAYTLEILKTRSVRARNARIAAERAGRLAAANGSAADANHD